MPRNRALLAAHNLGGTRAGTSPAPPHPDVQREGEPLTTQVLRDEADELVTEMGWEELEEMGVELPGSRDVYTL